MENSKCRSEDITFCTFFWWFLLISQERHTWTLRFRFSNWLLRLGKSSFLLLFLALPLRIRAASLQPRQLGLLKCRDSDCPARCDAQRWYEVGCSSIQGCMPVRGGVSGVTRGDRRIMDELQTWCLISSCVVTSF